MRNNDNIFTLYDPENTLSALDFDFDNALNITSQRIQEPLNIQLIIVDDPTMMQMNNQMRGKPTSTDVLSQPYDKNMGEIFICPNFIKNQGYDLNRVIYLFIHGVLHIAGHTHDHDHDFATMRDHEVHILTQLNQPNPYHEDL